MEQSQFRFGIGEWYGRSFVHLSPQERLEFATYTPIKAHRLGKAERDRIQTLKSKKSGKGLTAHEAARLAKLLRDQQQERQTNLPCPFMSTPDNLVSCNKPGGVCSLRLFENRGHVVDAVTDKRGKLRVICPNRFWEGQIAAVAASEILLGTDSPTLLREVGFLSGTATLDSDAGEDVGRFDMILLKEEKNAGRGMTWAALEVQAVYFSGEAMPKTFNAIKRDVLAGQSGLIWPEEVRRPDYRSSGPKRLMPQLQIKVPTLRRWGKKLAVIVDRAFFESLGKMETVGELSNCDIVWLPVDFQLEHRQKRFRLLPFTEKTARYTTLEEAVKGLTGGKPISMESFEEKLTMRTTVAESRRDTVRTILG